MSTKNYQTKTITGGVAVNNVIDAMSLLTLDSKRIRPSLETNRVDPNCVTSELKYARRRTIPNLTIGMDDDHYVTIELPSITVEESQVTDLTQLLVAYEPIINHIRDHENEFIHITKDDKHYIYYIAMNIYVPIVLTPV